MSLVINNLQGFTIYFLKNGGGFNIQKVFKISKIDDVYNNKK